MNSRKEGRYLWVVLLEKIRYMLVLCKTEYAFNLEKTKYIFVSRDMHFDMKKRR